MRRMALVGAAFAAFVVPGSASALTVDTESTLARSAHYAPLVGAKSLGKVLAPALAKPAVGEPGSGGWVIPASIVQCESGGQNLAPNSASASGFYQILGSTWTSNGGHGPAAYLAPKAEQDRVAARIWAGGAGRSQWVC